jgi:hypothetical protein
MRGECWRQGYQRDAFATRFGASNFPTKDKLPREHEIHPDAKTQFPFLSILLTPLLGFRH